MTSISRRTRSIGTKVTDEEYTRIVNSATPKTVSEWARPILVQASKPVDLEFLLLAELLALRTIVLNLHLALAEGGPVPSAESVKRLAQRADTEKVNKAYARIAERRAADNPTSRERDDA